MKDMDEKVRIYYPSYKEPESRNWFRCLTRIGPAFGATIEETPIMTRQEACDLVSKFPLFCDWEIEPVEGKPCPIS